ncbi:MAG: hypothetical protein KDB27_01165 [Planctomycetales bacterium]|nr:hypothetical protein [Planctomycetales bacterium]
MLVSPSAVEVRQIVRRILQDLGVSQADLDDMSETVRVEDGRCLARSYRAAGYLGMWLIDVGLLQFYDEEGNMIRHANLLAEIEPRRVAA